MTTRPETITVRWGESEVVLTFSPKWGPSAYRVDLDARWTLNVDAMLDGTLFSAAVSTFTPDGELTSIENHACTCSAQSSIDALRELIRSVPL